MKVKGMKTENQKRMEALSWHLTTAESWLPKSQEPDAEPIYRIRGYGALSTAKSLIDALTHESIGVIPLSDKMKTYIERYNKLVSIYGTAAE